MKIAVTGCLGTGKSTACKILAVALEAELIDTDQLCREQMLPGAEGFRQFSQIFGERFIQADGNIDRQLLRQAVFDDGDLRTQLEGILHPIVRRQVDACGRACSMTEKILIAEVPLLYEVGWQNGFDVCVVVYVPKKLCIQRVMARNCMLAEEVVQILNAQIPIEKKLDYAHFIVDNSGIFVSTVQQIGWLARTLKRKLKT